MDSLEFMAGIVRFVKEHEASCCGISGQTRALHGLVSRLTAYSVNYICPHRSSKLLREAQDCLFVVGESLSPTEIQDAATRARDLYAAYVQNNPFPATSVDITLMVFALNGLFVVPSARRREAQELLRGFFESLMDGFDVSGGFSPVFSDSHTRENAERAMQEVLAFAFLALRFEVC